MINIADHWFIFSRDFKIKGQYPTDVCELKKLENFVYEELVAQTKRTIVIEKITDVFDLPFSRILLPWNDFAFLVTEYNKSFERPSKVFPVSPVLSKMVAFNIEDSSFDIELFDLLVSDAAIIELKG